MSITIQNPIGDSTISQGGFLDFPVITPISVPINLGGGQFSRSDIPQVIGLVPVFPCNDLECRSGKFLNDTIVYDYQFPLPVFAQSSGTDLYFNDRNSFLFELPTSGTQSIFFYLDELINGTWTQVAALTDNTYGQFYSLPKDCQRGGSTQCTVLCYSLNWTGFTIYWQNVLNAFGEGMYRFRVVYNFYFFQSTCLSSPNFCLKTFDCYKANRTTKFETYYSGGIIGDVNKKNCGGHSWNFCCCYGSGQELKCNPIRWYDSIRIFGFFGREEKIYEKNRIKYQTGVNNFIRDEAIRKFKWSSFGNSADNPGAGLPFWFHDRFSVYGFEADNLLVSDYNLNNSDYGLNRYCVMYDGDYSPKYKGSSRYSNVELAFRSKTEYLIRTRCC